VTFCGILDPGKTVLSDNELRQRSSHEPLSALQRRRNLVRFNNERKRMFQDNAL